MGTINKKISGLIGAIIFTLAFAACGGENKPVNTEDTRPTIKATLAKAGGETVAGHTTLSGKIQAEKYANVSARIMGYLTNVRVKVGDQVRKGQVLATISSDEIKAKIAQADAGISEAKAALENIEKDYARVKALFDKKSATQKELDDITSAKDMTLAKLKQAQEMRNEVNTMLSYSRIKSPFNGIVTEKHVNSGDMASPGRPLFTVEAKGNFQAEVMVPESLISQISKGEKVVVVLKSSGKEIKGVIGELSSSSLHTGGQYLAKIDLDKKDLKGVKLLSGMYVNILLPEKNTSDAAGKIMVKKSAVVEQGQLTGIYTVSENNIALLRWVRLGKPVGDQVEVLSGLATGEDYIVEYEGRLLNGAKVRVK